MEIGSGNRVVFALPSAIVPGSGQILKKEVKKALLFLAVLSSVLLITWTTALYDTLAGLAALKIGAFALALVASLDASLSGAVRKPWYLVAVPILAALTLGDLLTGGIMLARGFRAFRVPSTSMQPSILPGDRILVDNYHNARQPQRGDVVAYRSPEEPRIFALKRIIGTPGDRIHLQNGIVYRNGQALDEPYAVHLVHDYNPYRDNFPAVPPSPYEVRDPEWARALPSHIESGDLVVPTGRYFCLGDNRDASYDSRYIGFIPRENVIGRPMFVYWPSARLGHRLASD